jgi:hypothetical protein
MSKRQKIVQSTKCKAKEKAVLCMSEVVGMGRPIKVDEISTSGRSGQVM